MDKAYLEFLESKKKSFIESGFDISEKKLNKHLFDFQKFAVKTALKKGKFALFFDCGLGKTLMQLSWSDISFEFTPFVNFISNYIYTEKMQDANGNDVIVDPNDPVPAFKFTQGNAQLFGGEIFLDFHPHPFDWLHVENSFSYVRATQNNRPENEKFLPFIPAPKYRGEIKTNFEKVNNTFSDFYAKFSVDHYFKQNNIYSAFDTETATPAYTLLSVGIGADIKAFGKKDFFNVFISGENLTDVAYQNHLSRLKYAPENPATGRMGVFNMGRNFSVKLMMNF